MAIFFCFAFHNRNVLTCGLLTKTSLSLHFKRGKREDGGRPRWDTEENLKEKPRSCIWTGNGSTKPEQKSQVLTSQPPPPPLAFVLATLPSQVQIRQCGFFSKSTFQNNVSCNSWQLVCWIPLPTPCSFKLFCYTCTQRWLQLHQCLYHSFSEEVSFFLYWLIFFIFFLTFKGCP